MELWFKENVYAYAGFGLDWLCIHVFVCSYTQGRYCIVLVYFVDNQRFEHFSLLKRKCSAFICRTMATAVLWSFWGKPLELGESGINLMTTHCRHFNDKRSVAWHWPFLYLYSLLVAHLQFHKSQWVSGLPGSFLFAETMVREWTRGSGPPTLNPVWTG